MEWYRLKLSGLKSSKIRLLMNNYKRVRELESESKERLKELLEDNADVEKVRISFETDDYFRFINYLEKEKIGLISLLDYRYPQLLKNISMPPLFLFFKGDLGILNNERMISVVGTRKATKYGELGVMKVIKDLVEADATIVSGLALGIDTLAHKETLRLKGKTVAVLGSGIDCFYPKGSLDVRKNIEKYGVVISEFPIGTPPNPQNFPIRNRIIAGLSKGVVVIESPEKSGSLITAELALEEGRDVFAIPGDICAHFSKGCNNLIRDSKGKLITSGTDILEEYSWGKVVSEKDGLIVLSGKKLEIYNVLKIKMHLEEIQNYVDMDTGELLSHLMELEIQGYIQSLSAGYYRRRV